jgi:hypothetical protein
VHHLAWWWTPVPEAYANSALACVNPVVTRS